MITGRRYVKEITSGILRHKSNLLNGQTTLLSGVYMTLSPLAAAEPVVTPAARADQAAPVKRVVAKPVNAVVKPPRKTEPASPQKDKEKRQPKPDHPAARLPPSATKPEKH